MGYTHYFVRNTKRLGSAFMYGKLALDTKAIIAEAQSVGIVIRDGYGKGSPEFTEGHFSLNGDSDTGEDYETFFWEALPEQPEWQRNQTFTKDDPNSIFDFCKTAHKPYDTVVTAVLIRAKVIYGECVDIRSDGNWSDWQLGRELYERVFGELAPNPFQTVSV